MSTVQRRPSTDAEIARIETVLPYHLDAWDGYYVERGVILETEVTFTPEEARADWRFVSTAKDRDYEEVSARSAARKTLPGDGNRSLLEAG